jgi:prepilin signal peptidase PulO-like enzyme (type II secretory pathway)
VWLGLKPIVPFLFFSGIFGIITGMVWRILKRGPLFPFGPSIALAMYLCVVFPELSNLFWNIGQFIK